MWDLRSQTEYFKNSKKMNSSKFNRWFNIFILAGMTVAMALATLYKLRTADSGQALLIVAAFGSLMGVLSTVCSANAKILTFLFGLFDVTIYGVMCFMSGKYGNAALHLLYFLPMQFVGFFQWRRRGGADGKKLKARRLLPRQRLLCGAAFLVGSALCYFILFRISGSAAPLAGGAAVSFLKLGVLADALSTVCNIFGQLLMSMAYMEQWVFWIGVNIASVVMWSHTLSQSYDVGTDSSYALIYLLKYSFYLLNSLNGLRIWLGLSRSEKA